MATPSAACSRRFEAHSNRSVSTARPMTAAAHSSDNGPANSHILRITNTASRVKISAAMPMVMVRRSRRAGRRLSAAPRTPSRARAGRLVSTMLALDGMSSPPRAADSAEDPAPLALSGTMTFCSQSTSRLAGKLGCSSWPSPQPVAVAAKGCQSRRLVWPCSPSSAVPAKTPAKPTDSQPPEWNRPCSAAHRNSAPRCRRRAVSSASTSSEKARVQVCGRHMDRRTASGGPMAHRPSRIPGARGVRHCHRMSANTATTATCPSSAPSWPALTMSRPLSGISSTWNRNSLSAKRSANSE